MQKSLNKDRSTYKAIRIMVAALFILSFAFNSSAYGHSEGGLTREVGQYKIQFVSNPEFPAEGERVILTFMLQNATSGLDLYNQTASVTLLKEGQVVQDFGAKRSPDPHVTIAHTFDKPGQYMVSIELLSANTVRADFPLEVASSFSMFVVLPAIAGLTLVIIIILVTRKVKNPK